MSGTPALQNDLTCILSLFCACRSKKQQYNSSSDADKERYSIKEKTNRSMSDASYLQPVSSKAVLTASDNHYELSSIDLSGDNHVYTALGDDSNHYDTPIVASNYYNSSASTTAMTAPNTKATELQRTDTVQSSYYEVIPNPSEGIYYNTSHYNN